MKAGDGATGMLVVGVLAAVACPAPMIKVARIGEQATRRSDGIDRIQLGRVLPWHFGARHV